jgi:photosystem II stability/assembly factor-like uncharacterized protein
MILKKCVLFGLILLTNINFVFAQCEVKTNDDMTIVCGDSIKLNAYSAWSGAIDSSSNVLGFRSVFFTNTQVGYTVGEDGIIHKTIDGGQTWSNQVSGTNVQLISVFFTNDSTGYVVGNPYNNTPSPVLLKTTNGGKNWNPLPLSSGGNKSQILFTNETTGFIVGEYGSILKTTDAGNSWQIKNTNTTAWVKSVFFLDANNGYAGADGVLLKTTDGGETWSILAGLPFVRFNSIHFIDINTGFSAASGGTIYKTINGGNSWTSCATLGNMDLSAVHFINANTGYVAGPQHIWKTTDAGKNWVLYNKGRYIFGLFFPSPNIGYATGERTYKFINADSFTWSPTTGLDGSNTESPVVKPLVTTTYSVVAKAGTCTFKDSVKIIVTPLIAEAGANKTVICGGSAQLDVLYTNYSGTKNLIYSWSPATGLNSSTIKNPVASPAKTTTYYVTVKIEGVACEAIDSVKVIVDPLTVYAAGTTDPLSYVCGGSAQFKGLFTNYTGSGTLSYLWSPSIGLNDATLEKPTTSATKNTTYHVVVTTPNGCEARDSSVKLVVKPLEVYSSDDVSIVCDGNGKFQGFGTNYSGSGPLSYLWSPATGLDNPAIEKPTVTATKNTTYKVLLTTPNGCSVTDSVTVFVNPLMIDAGVDQTIICGGKTKFYSPLINYTGNAKLSYLWSPANSLDSDTIISPTSNANKKTVYHVTLTTANGCVATDSLTIFVNPLVANAGNDKMNMCGDTVLLDGVTSNYTGTAPLTYSWLPTTGLHNATVSNPLTGAHDLTYTVTITTSNGCKASDQVRVDLKAMDAPEICMVGVDSTNKNVIRWNDLLWDAIDSVFIYRETTVAGNYVKIGSTAYSKNGFRDLTSQPEVKSNKYKISLLDTCGLESPRSVQHKTMHLAITKGIGTSWNLIWEPYEGFTVPTYNIYRGTDVNNLQLIDATSGTSTQFTNYNPPPGDLFYQVEVVNPSPCDASNVAKALRSNVAASKYVGIFEQQKNSFVFSVYPNPANNLLTVNLENVNNQNLSLTIYNAIGAVVKTMDIQQNQQQIDVSNLSNGLYMIELKSTNGYAVQKLAIDK